MKAIGKQNNKSKIFKKRKSQLNLRNARMGNVRKEGRGKITWVAKQIENNASNAPLSSA